MTANEEPRGRAQTIAALSAAGWSVARTASEIGVSPATVSRVRAEHREWIRQRRDDLADEASAQLLSLVPRTIDRLGQLVNSPNDAVALGACKFIVESSLRWRDALTIEAPPASTGSRRCRGDLRCVVTPAAVWTG